MKRLALDYNTADKIDFIKNWLLNQSLQVRKSW